MYVGTTLAVLGWLAQAGILYFMFAFTIPSALTVAGIVSLAMVIWIARSATVEKMVASAVAAMLAAVVVGLYRAGPTSGMQLANWVYVAAAAVTALLSAVAAIRLARSGPAPGDRSS